MLDLSPWSDTDRPHLDVMCHGTKSLRSSPLRGLPEGGLGNQLRGEL
jgi:hypothetical protein